MTIPEKLTQFLKRHHVYYEIFVHPAAATTAEMARLEDVPPCEVAKAVMVKAGRRNIMLVLPADHTVDLLKLSAAIGTKNLRIESEKEFQDLFEDCETGAMPPFGMLYHVRCYVDKSLAANPAIYFNAGTHTECISISTGDFLKVMKGKVQDFAVPGRKIAA